MRSFKSLKRINIIEVVFLLIFSLYGCNPPTPPPPSIPTSIVPPYVEGIFIFTDEIDFSLENKPFSNEIMIELQKSVESEPSNVRAYVMLAQAWSIMGNYRQVHQNLDIASKLDPKLSEPHFGLGNNYYDMALIDMVLRQEFTQHKDGYLLFTPDETTRQLFKLSLDEYNLGKTLPNSLNSTNSNGNKVEYYDPGKIENRIRQASLYVGNIPEETIFLEDQAKASIWMMKLDKEFPERGYMKTAEKMMNWIAEATQQSLAQDRYEYFAQQMEGGKESLGKKIFLQIDASDNPNKYIMGLTLEYHSLVSLIVLGCVLKEQDAVVAISGQLQDNINLLTIFSVKNEEVNNLLENPCGSNEFSQKLDDFVYRQLLIGGKQETADIFWISKYSFTVDTVVNSNNTKPGSPVYGMILESISLIQKNIKLLPYQALQLQNQQKIFANALNGKKIDNLDEIKIDCEQWLLEIVASRLNSQP